MADYVDVTDDHPVGDDRVDGPDACVLARLVDGEPLDVQVGTRCVVDAEAEQSVVPVALIVEVVEVRRRAPRRGRPSRSC